MKENKKYHVETSLPFLPKQLDEKKIGECEFGTHKSADGKIKEYFISIEIIAEDSSVALAKGENRIKRLLSIFSLINRFHYSGNGVYHASQILIKN